MSERDSTVVVIVSASLESNALGRALTLANSVPNHFQVEVWGPVAKNVWIGNADDRVVGLSRRALRNRLNDVNCEVARGSNYVFWISKGYPFSARLLSKLSKRAVVIADFDDHDVELARDFRRQRAWNRLVLNPLRSGSPERVTRSQAAVVARADGISVSSFALATALGLGGKVWRVPHGRPDLRCPAPPSRDYFSIGFLGTMRSHKGLSEIIEALKGSPQLRCVTFEQEALSVQGEMQWVLLPPGTPLVQAYGCVEASVLPMSESIGSMYQLPAKAVDSAAAGVPIVATPTPVLLEYFGEALLVIEDWGGLGECLERWKSEGVLLEKSQAVHDIWESTLSVDSTRETFLEIVNSLEGVR